jgi:hypothetical protein
MLLAKLVTWYCRLLCISKHHPAYRQYSCHRVRHEDYKDTEEYESLFGYCQCKDITQKGYRCKIKSTHEFLTMKWRKV